MLPTTAEFRRLVQEARTGNQEAATQLVRLYEPEIRRIVRLRLTDPKLRRILDSMDICQSVLGRFFTHLSQGKFELNEPADLLRLLLTMARNEVRDQARHQHRARRDQRREAVSDQEALKEIVGTDPTPSRVMAGKEMLGEVCEHLRAEERYLAEQRAAGRSWPELAEELHSTSEALRKRLARALDRVLDDLQQKRSCPV